MPIRLFAAFALLLFAPAAMAQQALAGSWAMRADDVTIARLEVRHDGGIWHGVWVRPAKLSFAGNDFTGVEGPVVRRTARTAQAIDGGVELTFDDPEPGSVPDVFRLMPTADGHVEATYVASHAEPFVLVRETATARLGPWDRNRRYVRTIARPTNAEMTAIYEADQAARRTSAIDWAVVGRQDEARRARTQALLDAGALHSGADFDHAAFIFQHGGKPDDYLKAHVLATVAVARGNGESTWIAAATLDRYLQSIERPQVFGTQYRVGREGVATQDPYDRSLMSDALRAAVGVPSQADQEARRKALEVEAKAAPTPAPKP